MPFYDTVTVVRPGGSPSPDGGDPIPNWATATTIDYLGEMQPLNTSEDVVGQQRTESTHLAFLPPNADIKPTDRVRFQGLDYEVEGIERWRAFDTDHHIEVRCFRITGG